MSSVINVAIHESQSPENVRRDLLESLRTRRVNHKFHYDSVKQTNKWLALHQAHSPSRNDQNCAATYNCAFASAAKSITTRNVHLIGLGCGGGQKDTRLLKLLKAGGKSASYTPFDVSLAMTLIAQQTARRILPAKKIFPFVCDLAMTDELPDVLTRRLSPDTYRLFSFFGTIHNFQPDDILPKLASLLERDSSLIFSANLAPGRDYEAGVDSILPQYDNKLTRDWLLTFLLDLGVERDDGELDFKHERGAGKLRRIAVRFRFHKSRAVVVEGRTFNFRAGENVQLFFSYRYTPELVLAELAKHGLLVCDQWITKSEEEGVFLCRRK